MANDLPDPTDDARSFDILTGMREWRLQHPNATLRQIEEALDERWYRVRARILEDLALRTSAASWSDGAAERPTCPDCGQRLIRRGRHVRQPKTHGGQELTLSRTYGYCPACNRNLAPITGTMLPHRNSIRSTTSRKLTAQDCSNG